MLPVQGRAHDLLRPCRLPAAGAVCGARTGIASLRCATPRRSSSGRRGRCAGDLRAVARRAARSRATSSASSSRSAPAPTSSRATSWPRGIRLASARGVNARAVAEHAMALMLALEPAASGSARQPGEAGVARHDRRSRPARGRARRQDAADRRLGDIGGRLARLAKAFDMRGDRAAARSGRRPRRRRCGAPMGELGSLLPRGGFRRADLPVDRRRPRTSSTRRRSAG